MDKKEKGEKENKMGIHGNSYALSDMQFGPKGGIPNVFLVGVLSKRSSEVKVSGWKVGRHKSRGCNTKTPTGRVVGEVKEEKFHN